MKYFLNTNDHQLIKNRVILKYATSHNHSQPPTTTHSHPQPPKNPPTTTQKTTHNYSELSTTTQKLPKKAENCHKQLRYWTLDVNTETDVGFDSDMK